MRRSVAAVNVQKKQAENMALVQLAQANGVAIGIRSNTFVIYYEHTPTMAGAQTIDDVISRALAKIERAAALVVIESSSRTPEPVVRDAIQRTMQRFAAKTEAIAYAVLGDGFRGAATRAAISGILMIVRPSYEAKVFASVPLAVKWLRSQSGARTMDNSEEVVEFTRFCSPPAEANQMRPPVEADRCS